MNKKQDDLIYLLKLSLMLDHKSYKQTLKNAQRANLSIREYIEKHLGADLFNQNSIGT